MISNRWFSIVFLPLFTTFSVFGVEEGDDLSKLVGLGQGVHKIKYDEKNGIKSLVVIGQAEIKTALGTAKGQLDAKKRAEQNAKAALTQWMKEHVMIVETSENETVITTENNGKDLIEKGKAVDKTKDAFASMSSAALSGLITIGVDRNVESKITSVMLAWKPSLSKIAQEVKGVMDYSEPNHEKGNVGGAQILVPQTQPILKSRREIAADSDEFLK